MDLINLSRENREVLAQALQERNRRASQRKIFTFYPDEGPLSRHNYPKQMEFFKAGATFRERAFMAANRVGKTEGAGGYEITCHLTGIYPLWWQGRRFAGHVSAWAAGDTNLTVRDILQRKLCGRITEMGTGLIPGDKIVDYKRKAGSIPDALETVIVRHVDGGDSILNFKSYEQGSEAFQGTEQDVILLDEEPPEQIYSECLIRTMTTNGIIMLTFTPLQGLSDVVLMFMPGGQVPEPGTTGKFCIMASWDDAPHLSSEAKAELWTSLPPHQRDARSKGIPQLGSGAIYPISEETILINDFKIPDYWPRAYGMDFGWNCTAGLWRARDPEHDIRYYYSEYKAGHSLPEVHAHAFKLRGEWIAGVSDPAGKQAAQKTGEKLVEEYRTLGLHLSLADNAVEAGIFDVWKRMGAGQIKVFRSLAAWLSEFRIYRRDENGKVVKENDHLMDCMRYEVRSGKGVERTMPVAKYIERNISDQSYNPLTHGLGARR